MLAYNRNGHDSDCTQQSLMEQFADKDGRTVKAEAKAHLTKFLDVTRSDMLFSDKVILVEGIAEKLLMPLFMEICGCSYEDEHVSIVEIGGKHFKYFVELFNGNAVQKKVLCITDKDFKWIDFDGDGNLRSYSEYMSDEPTHITELKKRFPIENFYICTDLRKLFGILFQHADSHAAAHHQQIEQVVICMKIVDHLERAVVIRHGIFFRHLSLPHPQGPSGQKLFQMIDIVIQFFRFFPGCGRQGTVVFHGPAHRLPPELTSSETGKISGICSGVYK